ncbi:hypothetical protein E1A91_A05G256100v1 [Gossypium mustelinum]|uniref:Uncharacterized protein n=1 Tax=Gossypium mustelinum TaxID=34275 RepID=A0A5D2ZCK5_GOSMU|nr:hypothetical protein E1A91_A05G256100v1 [Gossypium mustelinum]
MDRGQEEMQFLELFGIFKESYKIISSWRKLFTKITLALILPLSFIYLVHVEVSSLFSSKLQLDRIRSNTAEYENTSNLISHEALYFLLFNFAYFTMFYIFSLLSTAAVVYTIACIYTAREITFKTIISVVPKVWKRLIVIFLSIFVAIFLYLVVAAPVLIIWAVVLVGQMDVMGGAVLAVLVVSFTAGLFYLATIRQLATSVSVLEEAYGFAAMVKSENLIKGKLGLEIALFFILQPAMGLNHMAFKRLVVEGASMGMANRFVFAIICLLLLSTMSLFRLVIETVIYFVCKSYHHENIDKTPLSDHLEVYLQGEYAPLKAKDVQLFHV